ncbi:MAG: hypothetical protein WC294_06060 [Methanoregula sp.]
MLVMPGNHSSFWIGRWSALYPDKIGWICSPSGFRNIPYDEDFQFPYALDNGKFSRWDPEAFRAMLRRAVFFHKPLFVVVPDEICNHKKTVELFHQWKDEIRFYGYKLAFACQDGCTPEEVPEEADVCFIGGSTKWKWENAHLYKNVRPWLHIGRVNTAGKLSIAEAMGADSVDGTGFFRGDQAQKSALVNYLKGNKWAAL